MKAKKLICYGCKGGDGEPLRVSVFGDLDVCPECKRPFVSVEHSLCRKCQSPVTGRGDLCSSCRAPKEL